MKRRHTTAERDAIVAKYFEIHGAKSIADCVIELGVPKATLLRWVANSKRAVPAPLSEA